MRRWASGHRVWVVAVVAALLLVAGCSGGGSAREKVSVEVSPSSSRMVEPVSIRVTGLDPGQKVRLRLTSTDARGVRWSSSARFRATDDGEVDLANAKPVSGDYERDNGMGLVEAMEPRGDSDARYYFWSRHGPQSFTVTVLSSDGKRVARSRLERGVAGGVAFTTQSVADEGFDGAYYQGSSSGRGKRPAILAFGGSEGGNSTGLVGSALAAAGYPTLTISYFHAPGLPPHLVKIPLEYFAKALRWLVKQPGVDRQRIYVLGVSRGSEAAQLVAVHYPELVHGVIAVVPSGVVHEGLTGGTGLHSKPAGESAWSFNGKPIPYAIFANDPHPSIVPRSVIPVERIDGPIFLACAGHDQLWPSCPFSHAIVQRLEQHDVPYRHVLAEYPEAGHGLGFLLPYEPTDLDEQGPLAGLHRLSNQRALADVWPRLIRFLHRTSRPG